MTIADLSIVPCTCPRCGETTRVHVLTSQWEAYQAGTLAQDAFPDLTVAARETIISGLCGWCQSILFEGYDEEEDE